MRCVCVCVSPADEERSSTKQLWGGNQAATERMIQFGRELQALSEQLCREYGSNATHKKMLQVRRCYRLEKVSTIIMNQMKEINV